MENPNATEEMVVYNAYLKREPLTTESIMLVRLRVAMRCVERIYKVVEHRISEKDFPAFGLTLLARRRRANNPHPLEEEMTDVLRGWARGEMFAETYMRGRYFAARRVVRQVKYGGRRG